MRLTAVEAAIEDMPVAKSELMLLNADRAAELTDSKLSRAACRRARHVSELSKKVGVRTQLK
jgi:hypothetical protein